jgi:DNA-binding CsgD family transcriptional regulator
VPNIKSNSAAIITILLLVIASNILDLAIDFANDASLWHLIQEVIVISLAIGLIIFLTLELKQKKRHLQDLVKELKTTEHSLTKSTAVIQNARKEYSEIIHQQFDDWQLSQSQQQIALLLLKGLSFNEIAAIRDTKEKTVRQQASEIYKKADVVGRHAFSAWFFEDFLN